MSPSESRPVLKILISTIVNLQQIPLTNLKIMLKIFIKDLSQTAADTYIFSFITLSNSKAKIDIIKDVFSIIISIIKVNRLPIVCDSRSENNASFLAVIAIINTIFFFSTLGNSFYINFLTAI